MIIYKATNNIYNKWKINYLTDYFGYGYDKKPTHKIVITTIMNKVLF